MFPLELSNTVPLSMQGVKKIRCIFQNLVAGGLHLGLMVYIKKTLMRPDKNLDVL